MPSTGVMAKRCACLDRATGRWLVRASEALGVHIEDLTLTPDDEHVTVHG